VTDAPSIPSEDSIQSQIDSTITEDKLSTIITSDFIQTNNILVNAAQINGKLTADKIDVNSLAVQHLNTTPGETKAGTIKIENNDIRVYDSSETKEILLITGNRVGTDIAQESNVSFSRINNG
jgi:hypothetical protein